MATIRCTVCAKVYTSRVDGLCDVCWQARKQIETSLGAAHFARIVIDCEKDWALMDRIDHAQRKQQPQQRG